MLTTLRTIPRLEPRHVIPVSGLSPAGAAMERKLYRGEAGASAE